MSAPAPAAPRPPARLDRWEHRLARWPPRTRLILAGLVFAAGAIPHVVNYLVLWPRDHWQVDVDVYRQAGLSVLLGRPLYEVMTEAPQLLPFTYPPFAAILVIPLTVLPFGAVGWLWTGAQLVANIALVWYAGAGLWGSFAQRWPALLPVAVAAVSGALLWMLPVSDGLRFGQVNVFLVLACLLDLRGERPRVLARVPRGVLVGVATAIKLTPGVFIVHYLVCRRWREAATAIATATACTLGAWVVLPAASFAFWGGALQDPTRLGPNMSTSNQSLRGVLLRHGVGEPTDTVIWLALVAVVAVAGYALARRCWQRHDTVAEVAVVGLIAVLVSPVSWIHHYHWMVVVILALASPLPLGDADAQSHADGRVPWWPPVLLTAWFWARLPWWGAGARNNPLIPDPLAVLLLNGAVLGALLALVLLWRRVSRRSPRSAGGPTASP